MRIAVAYSDGEIFGHFGKAEQFKLYDVLEGKVVGSTVIDSEGSGHGELAAMLVVYGVNAVICGGIGNGAQSALNDVGIEIISGVSGNADEAVDKYLQGELVSEGVNCNCKDNGDNDGEEGCGCGSSCGSSCGGCGSSCGGCGGGMPKPLFEGANVGKACTVNYKGYFNDGTVFDSSFERGEPIQFICGIGMMIKGFDKAVADMKVGETVDIHLMPEEAYGPMNPDAIIDIEISNLPGSEDLEVGDQVYLSNGMGQQFPVKVLEKTETTIKLDANHEMAGKELNFTIELVEVLED